MIAIGHQWQCDTSTYLDLPREWTPGAAQEGSTAGLICLCHIQALQRWGLPPNKLASVGTTKGISLTRGSGQLSI